jgi:hypothetical protein
MKGVMTQDNNGNDLLDYGRLIDEAMHMIVKKALELVGRHGLPGEHHFYISFATNAPGVMISDELKKKYTEEMTIVLQHQFWELEIEEDRFSIVLSFDNVKQNLTVPFAAITSFADPSVKFGLQFRRPNEGDFEDEPQEEGEQMELEPQKTKAKSKTAAAKKPPKTSNSNNVVTLDSFRNNNKK